MPDVPAGAPGDNPFAVLIPPATTAPEPGPATPAGHTAPRTPAAILVLPGGARVPIDGPIVIGRNPRTPDDGARVVVLDAAGAHVSRTHARVRLDGEQLVLDDLGSRNGTGLTPPGQPRRKVAPGGSAPLPIGSVIHFGAHLEATIAPA